MTKQILIAIIFGELISCGQQQKSNAIITNVKVDDTYKPAYTVTQLNDKLELSFKQEQPDSFYDFFSNWNRIVQPNFDNFINQNDTINAVFNVYRELYKPFDLLKLGEWDVGNKLNSKSKYVVVQNKIFYSVLPNDNFDDFVWKNSKRDSIANFRPPINLDENKVLYLTDEYAKAINIFLGTESTELGEYIFSPPSAVGNRKRYDVIRKYIPILTGYWLDYWHLETHPDINLIIFNKSLTKA